LLLFVRDRLRILASPRLYAIRITQASQQIQRPLRANDRFHVKRKSRHHFRGLVGVFTISQNVDLLRARTREHRHLPRATCRAQNGHRLSPSCLSSLSIPSHPLWPVRHYPHLRISARGLGLSGTSTHLNALAVRHTLRAAPPLCPASVLWPSRFAPLVTSPFASGNRFSRSVQEPG